MHREWELRVRNEIGASRGQAVLTIFGEDGELRPNCLGWLFPPAAICSPGKTRALLRHCEPPYRACRGRATLSPGIHPWCDKHARRRRNRRCSTYVCATLPFFLPHVSSYPRVEEDTFSERSTDRPKAVRVHEIPHRENLLIINIVYIVLFATDRIRYAIRWRSTLVIIVINYIVY